MRKRYMAISITSWPTDGTTIKLPRTYRRPPSVFMYRLNAKTIATIVIKP